MCRAMRHPLCVLALLLLVWGGGCGFGALQTARPTPKGAVDLTLGAGAVYNSSIQERGFAPANAPLQIGLRVGVADRVDLGFKQFYLLGLEADTKVNLLDPQSPWALSLRGGVGAANDDGAILHLPLALAVSYDFACRLTPYLHLGYELYWIFGREEEDTATVDYVGRKGYGDHLLTATAGLQYRIGSSVAVMVEYNYWQPLLDDPGDFYSFVPNHIVLAGIAIRLRSPGRF